MRSPRERSSRSSPPTCRHALTVLPLAEGSTGPAITDVQERLAALGHVVDGDTPGVFGPSTKAAVEAFQRRRGLRIDGIVGSLTWDRLVEAGRVLGDRVLLMATPMPRGDDVAELQERLAALGFDPGRVDGIFGEATRAAVVSFQRDAGLVDDGIAGPATLLEVRRLAVRYPRSTLVNEVKERSGVRFSPGAVAGMTVAIGQAGGLEVVVEATARALRLRGAHAIVVRDVDESALAATANAAGAACLVVLRLDPGTSRSTALYFASERSQSPAGMLLAQHVAEATGKALALDHAVAGMTLPVLRETQMPAVVVEFGPLDRVVERTAQLAAAVVEALEGWTAPRA